MGAKQTGWYLARRDTRWDVYPQREELVRVYVEYVGQIADTMVREDGAPACNYILDAPCEPPADPSAAMNIRSRRLSSRRSL